MRDLTSRLAARCIDAVRIHHTRERTLEGVVGYHKERRWGMVVFYGPGNLFLRMSNSRIRMFASAGEWQRREVESFRLCHPGRVVKPLGRQGLFMERLPGKSLRELAGLSLLDADALRLGAAELRRVHALQNPADREPWSHGDPHLGNFLFDAGTARCYIIDFETAHLPGYSAIERQSDDVLTFCLELLGCRETDAALQNAAAFLKAYGRPEILAAVCERLRYPHGIERVLWATRTDYLPGRELRLRLVRLRALLGA